jgi:hypothetical protein
VVVEGVDRIVEELVVVVAGVDFVVVDFVVVAGVDVVGVGVVVVGVVGVGVVGVVGVGVVVVGVGVVVGAVVVVVAAVVVVMRPPDAVEGGNVDQDKEHSYPSVGVRQDQDRGTDNHLVEMSLDLVDNYIQADQEERMVVVCIPAEEEVVDQV